MILTDGEVGFISLHNNNLWQIHDMDYALENIVDSWNLPLSIIIVGIGNENVKIKIL